MDAFILIGGFLILYMLPSIVAVIRGHEQKGMIIVANIFLAWTFIFWAVLLVLSFYREEVTKVEIIKPVKVLRG